MKKIKYIMFDFDNTLVDSLDYWYKSIDKEAFKYFGSPINNDFPNARRGLTNRGIVECFVRHLETKVTIKEAEKFWHERMLYYYTTKIKLIHGIKDFLEKLLKMDYKLVLASATPMNVLTKAIKHFDLEKYFTKIYTEDTLKEVKHNPRFYELMLSDLKISAEEFFVFEDSYSSLKSANSLNIKTCALITKYNRTRLNSLNENNLMIIKNYKTKKLNTLPLFN